MTKFREPLYTQTTEVTQGHICERALKMTILHRKNGLFFETRRGARVGDLFISMIHTCPTVSG